MSSRIVYDEILGDTHINTRRTRTFLQTPVFPMDVTLRWDKNTQVDGYKIYYKKAASGPPYNGADAAEGDSPVDVGWVSEFTLRSLSDDEDYYYIAVTAYNSYGESGYSDEVKTGRSVSVSSGLAGGGESASDCFISTILRTPASTLN